MILQENFTGKMNFTWVPLIIEKVGNIMEDFVEIFESFSENKICFHVYFHE
jgi:hypothetical protein